jgi:hypothetical protein
MLFNLTKDMLSPNKSFIFHTCILTYELMTILCHVLACESQMLQYYRAEKYLEIRWGLCLVTSI